MRPLYPTLALFLVLIALLYLTAQYFPNGPGKPATPGWHPHDLPPPDPKEPVKTTYTKGELTQACEQSFRNANASFDAIAQTPEKDRSIDNTLLRFEETMGDYYDATAPLSLMEYVHPGREIAAGGPACEECAGVFAVTPYSRRDPGDARAS